MESLRSGNMRTKLISTRRTFTFPGSIEEIEIVNFKNLDGTFAKVESVFFLVRTLYDTINNYLSALITLKGDARYNVKVVNVHSVEITEILKVHENWNYSDEKMIYALSSCEVEEFKAIITEGVAKFVELFSTYYQSKLNRESQVGNSELAGLLRLSNGAKIKFLDDVLSWYLALNGQTYFDVVAHLVITNAYTLGSLFSTTALYYHGAAKLRGKALLSGASRKTFPSLEDRLMKGEIHTMDGLIIFHARQFRLNGPRKARVFDDHFEPIMIEEQSSTRGSCLISMEKGLNELTPISNQRVEDFERIARFKLITMEGMIVAKEVTSDLVQVMIDNDITCSQLDAQKSTAILDTLSILENRACRKVLLRLQPYLKTERLSEILLKLREIDGLGSATAQKILRNGIVPFLALFDIEEKDEKLTIMYQLLMDEDVLAVISQCIGDFQYLL